MKYTIKNYIKAYSKHICSVFFWGMIWWKITPSKIRKYIMANIILDLKEKNRIKIIDKDILEQAERITDVTKGIK